MSLVKKPSFQAEYLEEDGKKQDSFTVYLNKAEREYLNKQKKIIEQKKDSTALKQLAWIGANLIDEPKMQKILSVIYSNKRNNKRSNIADFE